jgi:hypothetical protein
MDDDEIEGWAKGIATVAIALSVIAYKIVILLAAIKILRS